MREEAQQALEHFLGKKSGHLVLGASTIPGEYILPSLLGQFKKLHPTIKITLRIGDTEEIVNELLNSKIELGIIGAKISHPRLQYSPFVKDVIDCSGPPRTSLVEKNLYWCSRPECRTIHYERGRFRNSYKYGKN